VNNYRRFEDNMILINFGKHLQVDKTEDLNLQFLFAMNLSNAASKFRAVNKYLAAHLKTTFHNSHTIYESAQNLQPWLQWYTSFRCRLKGK
jgi:hypothetical protein